MATIATCPRHVHADPADYWLTIWKVVESGSAERCKTAMPLFPKHAEVTRPLCVCCVTR